MADDPRPPDLTDLAAPASVPPREGRGAEKPGRVYLVGAGPGDPGLITLRGIECLRTADLVVYDYLVNAEVLRHSPPSAERFCLRHHGATPAPTQDAINARIIAAARDGKTVVRLKGGDPAVFGRTAEEAEPLRAAGLTVELVPGVTAALAAAAYAEIPLTHSHRSSAVALVTGQERHGKAGPPLDYGSLAQFPGTLVFYMGITSAAEWSRALIERGKPPDTPVAVIRRCSWNEQTVHRATIATVADLIAEHHLRPPAVIVVGEVVDLAPADSWFAARPLFGRRVLVTRPRHQADSLSRQLAELGAQVLVQPAIEIGPPPTRADVDRAIDDLGEFDWLVFSSSNGVRSFLDRLCDSTADLRRLGRVRLAAIGPGTAEELARYRLRPDLVPVEYRAESLAAALAPEARGRRFLLIRASRGREVLAEDLTAAGGLVRQVVAYTSTDVEQPDPEIAEALAAGRIDWITVTSSAIARSLVRLFGDALGRSRLASISPITSSVLREHGYPPAVEAAQYTMPGLVEAIVGRGSM